MRIGTTILYGIAEPVGKETKIDYFPKISNEERFKQIEDIKQKFKDTLTIEDIKNAKNIISASIQVDEDIKSSYINKIILYLLSEPCLIGTEKNFKELAEGILRAIFNFT
jgi:hypothetical protein